MRTKVLFVIESLGGGGAEKVLSTIVAHIDKQRFDVTVYVITAGGKYEEDIARHVRLYSLLKNLESYHGVGKLWYWLKYHLVYDWLPLSWVYKIFLPQGNDVEIAFVEGYVTKLLSFSTNTKAKKIAWVHVDLKQRPWPIQMRIFKNVEEECAAYCQYKHVICVSHSVENVMREDYRLNNVCTIYNPLDEEDICVKAQKEIQWNVDKMNFNIVSIGRLEHQKGYDLLLPIIKRLKDNGARIHLWLIGEGTQHCALENQVSELGIIDNVTFTGFQSNPYSLMSRMDLFVCSSRAEGFSLVIAEALILNIPVLSMNCSGPNELLVNDVTSLCNSYEELYEKINEIITGTKEMKAICKPVFLQMDNVMSQIEEILVE